MFSVFKSSVYSDVPSAFDPSHTVSYCAPSKHQSVHSLNLKYDGSTHVRAFLQHHEELCASRGISKDRPFTSAAELFEQNCMFLCWYRSIKVDAKSWSQIWHCLVDEHFPYDYDRRLTR